MQVSMPHGSKFIMPTQESLGVLKINTRTDGVRECAEPIAYIEQVYEECKRRASTCQSKSCSNQPQNDLPWHRYGSSTVTGVPRSN